MPKAPPRFEDIAGEYRVLWDKLEVRSSWTNAIDRRARQVIGNRDRYEAVSESTGVPWWMIGAIHSMESGLNFSRHLHNGDSLKRRTHRVPAGRPRRGRPPYSWEESADDAIRQKGWHRITDWSIERVLYQTERFNGFGYRMYRNIRSPYLWSGSQWYSRGKYVSDGKWSRTAVSGQTGAACLMKRIQALTAEISQPIDIPLPERAPMNDVGPGPVEEEENSPIATPKAQEPHESAPIEHAARRSKTILGALLALLGVITQWLNESVAVLMEAANSVTDWSPAKSVLTSVGANAASIGFGLAVFGIVLAISRRLNAAHKGKVG